MGRRTGPGIAPGRREGKRLLVPGEGPQEDELEVAPLVAAAAARGLPLRVLDIDGPEAAALYDRALVISRPDQHVAWRGDAVPADPEALVDLLRGVAPAAASESQKERETSA